MSLPWAPVGGWQATIHLVLHLHLPTQQSLGLTPPSEALLGVSKQVGRLEHSPLCEEAGNTLCEEINLPDPGGLFTEFHPLWPSATYFWLGCHTT